MSVEFEINDRNIERAIELAERSSDVVSYSSDDISPGDVEKAMTKHGEGPVWFCWTGTKEDALFTAITGNGPTSEHNAAFYSCARDLVIGLGRELQRLRARAAPSGGTDG